MEAVIIQPGEEVDLTEIFGYVRGSRDDQACFHFNTDWWDGKKGEGNTPDREA